MSGNYRGPGPFTNFQYSYTLGPPSATRNGDYNQYPQFNQYPPQGPPPQQGPYGGPPQPPHPPQYGAPGGGAVANNIQIQTKPMGDVKPKVEIFSLWSLWTQYTSATF
jgi:hypothetical protein